MKSLISSLIGFVLSVSVNAAPLVEGRVRLDSGESVEAAQVRIFDMTNLRRGAVAQATTDATGYFALPLAALTGSVLPTSFTLGQNYPNPFNPSTIIPYQLAAAAPVRLEVFNLLGQRIATLVDGERPAGFHTATWHATDAAGRAVGAGVYIYRMTVAAERQTGRMVLLDGQAGVSAGGTASVWSGASGGSRSDGEQVYGLIVSGEGLAPYVDSSFRVEAGMAPVELVVQAGQHLAGKATDDDCAFCDLFDVLNDDDEGPSPSGKAQATLEVPAAPTNLRFEAVTDSSCRVRWDAAEGATDYDVNYKRAVGGKWTNEPHKGVRLYNTIYDLEPNTEYRWAARAENGDGASEWVFGPNFTTLSDHQEGQQEGQQDGQDSDVVSIPDAKLRAAIAEALGKARGATITVAEMKTLAGLDADYSGIRDLTGLEFATNLTELDLIANDISDISALRGLTNLKWLYLHENAISDISVLSGLTNLTSLGLGDNAISDISALSGLTNLTSLSLDDNAISDISALSGLTNLKWLSLDDNAISDISALSGLTNLTKLWLTVNAISDISALRGLTKLEWLDLRENAISDISALSGLTNLTKLWLTVNDISDISALRGLTKLTGLNLRENAISDISAFRGLTKLELLDLRENDISDISALRGLTKLEWLDLTVNDISDISALRGLTNLTKLWIQDANISDISALRDLTNLTGLNLRINNISDISVLSGLPNLTKLDLIANDISDISALRGLTNLTELSLDGNSLSASSINDHIPVLQARGVTVKFDPTPGTDDPTPVFTTENLIAQHDGVAQYDDRVVVMGIPGRLTTDPIEFDALAQGFFAHYEDAFDYLMVFSNLANRNDNQYYTDYVGTHMGVQNTIQGTGRSRYSRNQTFGSAGKLNAILHFPYNSALLDGPSLHEIMHSWANYTIPTAVGSHWGFSSANGQLGGFDRANLIEHGGGRYSAGSFGTFANYGNSLPYSPIELYFAGLIPPSEIPDLWVAEDGEWSDEWDDAADARIFTASQVSTWSIERIVAEHGARIPNSRQSQKDFRAAFILLIDSKRPAQQGTLDDLSAEVQEFTHAGPDDESGFNFWEATGGRATLTMDGLSAYRRSGRASKPVVSYRIVEPVANQDGHIGCVPMGDATEVGKWMVAPSDKGKRITLLEHPSVSQRVSRAGRIELPTKPGLGFDLIESEVKKTKEFR